MEFQGFSGILRDLKRFKGYLVISNVLREFKEVQEIVGNFKQELDLLIIASASADASGDEAAAK